MGWQEELEKYYLECCENQNKREFGNFPEWVKKRLAFEWEESDIQNLAGVDWSDFDPDFDIWTYTNTYRVKPEVLYPFDLANPGKVKFWDCPSWVQEKYKGAYGDNLETVEVTGVWEEAKAYDPHENSCSANVFRIPSEPKWVEWDQESAMRLVDECNPWIKCSHAIAPVAKLGEIGRDHVRIFESNPSYEILKLDYVWSVDGEDWRKCHMKAR